MKEVDESARGGDRSPMTNVHETPAGTDILTRRVARPRPHTVHDDIAGLLRSRGWARGAGRRGTRLSLRAAIDEVVGVSDDPAPSGVRLARAGRVASHLRGLAGCRNLDAWSDARDRTFEDVMVLLHDASIAFGDD
jgi:hypothetical protein